MPSEGFIFEEKPVFDWNHVQVGTVTQAYRDPKTKATRQLVLTLSPQAKTALGADEIELPTSYVFGMRRDGVTLNRSLNELKRIEYFASVLKK